MRKKLTYYLLLTVFLFGCKNELPPNIDNLTTILNSQNFKVTITSCHGNITGKNHCHDEIMFFDSDTFKFKTNDKTYIKLLSKSKKDSLYRWFYELLDFHQSDKKIGKDGFGCLYHDYNFTFHNDSIELTIKPYEGNGIYYRIQEILDLDRYMNIVNGHEYVHQLDSNDFLLLKNQKIVNILKLIDDTDGKEEIVGLFLTTSRNDISFSIIPSPNPGFSFNQLSPISIYLKDNEFYNFIELPKRQIRPLSEADTVLKKIIGLDIKGVEFVFKPKDEFIDNSKTDIYGLKAKDKFLMCIYFESQNKLILENKGLSLDIYE